MELGVARFDTADMYADGYSEEILGKFLVGYERSNLFVTPKVSPQNLEYEDVISSCKASLKRLQTDYLDLYLIHIPNPDILLKETRNENAFTA